MARFNEILTGRFNRSLQKSMQIKGGPPSASLASEIMPTWAMFRGAEDRVLEGWYRFGARGLTAATVGQSGCCQLRNPKSSGVIVVVEHISFMSRTTTEQCTLSIGSNDTDLANNMALAPIDSRGKRTAGASAKATQADVQTGVPQELVFLTASAPNAFTWASIITTDNQEIVLAPGDELKAFSGQTNDSFIVNFIWRERALEDSELSI